MRRPVQIAILFAVVPLVLVVAVVVGPIEVSRAAPVFTVAVPEDAPDAAPDGNCASTYLGLCTLRAAIQEAERAGGGVVVLPVSGLGDFRLTIPPGPEATGPPSNATGDLDISTTIRVEGAGVDVTAIDGQGAHRIFDVHAGGALTLQNLTLQNGKGDYDGATNHVHGGAIHNHGWVSLYRVAVINSSVDAAGWGGGGITNAGTGVAQLASVTVARNATAAQGGGIENLGELRLLGVTVAENSASLVGGGIYVAPNATVVTAAALVAQNAGGDCKVPAGFVATSSGANLAEDGSCGFTNATDRTGSPGFDTSVFGPPLFYPLLASSQALDTGYLCQPFDVRGGSRPLDGNGDGVPWCDSGSYESAAVAVPTCNGLTATISVNTQGVVVGGPGNGRRYGGKLSGTAGDDVIVGTSKRDLIWAKAGDDVVCAGDGDDEIDADAGNDTITGGPGPDRFDGGAGKDQATDFSAAEGDLKKSVEKW
ncbi:MAG TPA: hypothetical protein VH950_06515 [Gaiellaceae bacterium]|jgi:hypothetical protein